MITLKQPDASLKNFFYDWISANEWLFRHINSLREDWYDKAMVLVSHLAQNKFFPFYFAAVAAIFLVQGILRKLSGRAGLSHLIPLWIGVLVVLCVSFGLEIIVVKLVKLAFQYPRPFIVFGEENVHLIGPEAQASNPYESFPSGHTAFVSVMVFSLWPVLSKNMRLFGLFCIALVAWSRISLGAHFPADTFYAFLIGLVVVTLTRMTTIKVLRGVFGLKC